jgi:hypothetical protein
MAYIIKEPSIHGEDPYYYIENGCNYKDIEEVKEYYPRDTEVRITDEDYDDLYHYEQDKLEELFNKTSGGYTP